MNNFRAIRCNYFKPLFTEIIYTFSLLGAYGFHEASYTADCCYFCVFPCKISLSRCWSIERFQVFLGGTRLLDAWSFHSSAIPIILSGFFLIIWLIYLHFLRSVFLIGKVAEIHVAQVIRSNNPGISDIYEYLKSIIAGYLY